VSAPGALHGSVVGVTRQTDVPLKPRLRGFSHTWAFYVSIATAVPLTLVARGVAGQVAAAVFAAAVTVMFGVSALYNRVEWAPAAHRLMRRVDHSAIFVLIAGSYTPYGLLVLDGAWRIAILAVVWTGVTVAVAVRLAWVHSPGWLTAVIALSLGWVSVVALPQAIAVLPPGGLALLLAGGGFYTAGALVYMLRRPNPRPAVFGFHEVFHLLVIAAVACHYATVAFFLLPVT
jgi:hemolysin III